MTYMLDTNICIYVMKNKPEKVLERFREELDGGLGVSSITLAELEYGMKHSSNPAKNEQALLRFLAPLSILPFGAAAASEYGALWTYLQNNGTPIGPLDMLIAGHALAEGLTLVTNNVREFERVPDLRLENWAEWGGCAAQNEWGRGGAIRLFLAKKETVEPVLFTDVFSSCDGCAGFCGLPWCPQSPHKRW